MTVSLEYFCHFDFKFQQGVKIVGKEEKGVGREEVKEKRQAGLFAEFYWLQSPCAVPVSVLVSWHHIHIQKSHISFKWLKFQSGLAGG